MKTGIKTTEFWLVVVSSIVAVLVAAGVIDPTQGADLETAVGEVINAVINLVAVLTPLVGVVSYVWSRTKVKLGK
jgi:hypothetical protein